LGISETISIRTARWFYWSLN